MSLAGIGGVVAAMAVTTIIFEFPFGILADRWSRKGVVLLSSIAIIGSTLFGALATAPWHYLMTQVLWGVFYAMYTGIYDAMVYDVLVEEHDEEHYEFWFGRVGRYDSIALVTSSVAGGLVAGVWGLRAAYWLTIPMMILCAVSMLYFKEPKVHKRDANALLFKHIKETTHEVTKTRLLWLYLLAAFAMGAACRVFFEFDQVWLSELNVPVVLFGVINAGILSSIGFRSVLADRVDLDRHEFLVMCLLAALVFAGLLAIPNAWVVAIALCGVAISLMTAMLILNGLQQKHFSSKLRAGANSMTSTLTHLCFVPLSIGFGFMSARRGVSVAAWLPFSLLALSLLATLRAKEEGRTVKTSKTELQ